MQHRVKIFFRHACLECLPTRANLQKRLIDIRGVCCLCDSETETLTHVLLHCPSIAGLWTTYLPVMANVDCNQSVFNVAVQVRTLGGLEALAIFFTIASSLCFRRNNKLQENELLDARQGIEHALIMHKMFVEVKTQHGSDLRTFCGWKLPLVGFLKINVDGATFPHLHGATVQHLHRASVGAILRDAQGKVLMAVARENGRWIYGRYRVPGGSARASAQYFTNGCYKSMFRDRLLASGGGIITSLRHSHPGDQ